MGGRDCREWRLGPRASLSCSAACRQIEGSFPINVWIACFRLPAATPAAAFMVATNWVSGSMSVSEGLSGVAVEDAGFIPIGHDDDGRHRIEHPRVGETLRFVLGGQGIVLPLQLEDGQRNATLLENDVPIAPACRSGQCCRRRSSIVRR